MQPEQEKELADMLGWFKGQLQEDGQWGVCHSRVSDEVKHGLQVNFALTPSTQGHHPGDQKELLHVPEAIYRCALSFCSKFHRYVSVATTYPRHRRMAMRSLSPGGAQDQGCYLSQNLRS